MNQEGLGKYIREQREPFISLRGFAKQMNISASYLSDIELGKRSVSKAMVLRLCVGLGRVVDGDIYDIHRSYNEMLRLSGHLSRERVWLLTFVAEAADADVDVLETLVRSTYEALYEELDLAFANSMER